MNTSAARLEVRDLSLTFGGVVALDGISLTVEPGEFFGIIGPNGAGKSSLLNCMTGVYTPTAGDVRLDGESLIGLTSAAIASSGIARTFQNLGSFTHLSVLDNVMLGRHYLMRTGTIASIIRFGRSRREEWAHRRKAEEIIELLELEAVRNEPVGDLPYGIQKKVELARALAAEPKVLLLDEPVAGMNLHESEAMAYSLLTVRAVRPVTIVLIEHDLALVMDLADRIAVLDHGSLVACDRPELIRDDPAVRAVYTGFVTDEVSGQ